MGHVWLIGMMGTGKTTSGRILAEMLGVPFVDADEVIAGKARASIAEIFRSEGEGGFRTRERSVIAEIAAGPAAVVAAGGGAALDPTNAETMRATGDIVLLEASAEALLTRLEGDTTRPLLASAALKQRVEDLLTERAPRYRTIADVVIDTSALDARAVADQIAER
jgi:shikimate kinase